MISSKIVYRALSWCGGVVVLVGGALGVGVSSVQAANVRDLEGVDIISREEWGADESLRYLDSSSRSRWKAETVRYKEWLAGRGVDRGGKFAARKRNEESIAEKNKYLSENFPQEQYIDFVQTSVDGHDLVWPQAYKYKKKKIVVHHTADDDLFQTQSDVMSGVRNIYKFHTITRGWGDIGYNFLIDQFGNIYEGRAGGAGVVGAHAERNNADTVGIALMGNFDVQQPTKEMMDALLRLMTAVAWKYSINVDAEQTYFRSTSTAPYIATTTSSSLVGHGDTKATACPGEYVESQLPLFKSLVKRYLAVFRQLGRLDFAAMQRLSVDQPFSFAGDNGTISIPLVGADPTMTCTAVAKQLQISSCTVFPSRVEIGLVRKAYPASGPQYFLLQAGGITHLVDVPIVWEKDLALLHQQRRAEYFANNTLPKPVQSGPKIITKQPVSDVQQLMQSKARVLLYELTTSSPNGRQMTCSPGCTVRLDTQAVANARIINVNVNGDTLDVYIDLKKRTGIEAVELENSDGGLITFGNYARQSYAGVPRNTFRGNIAIKKDVYVDLTLGERTAYAVINTLPVTDYLRGIAEASDADSMEKIKAMALLVKAYMLYYIAGKNNHPNIPAGASYAMVDDARIFQKYVGAGYEQTGKKWFEALGLVDGEVISYKGILPILPYFSCSAGFVFGGQEKRGWTDTPYLQGKLDVASCGDGTFQGHGVGLSGRGAQQLAAKGATYRELLQYYYPGTEVTDY